MAFKKQRNLRHNGKNYFKSTISKKKRGSDGSSRIRVASQGKQVLDMSESHRFVNKIYQGDSRRMKRIPDGVVSLVVCSPPYNVKKPYANHNDDMPLEDYKEMLRQVWLECKRVLMPGGRLCINVAGIWRQPYLPLHAIIWQQLIDDLDFKMRGEIIWHKRASVGASTAWGSFASPSNPTLRDEHEYILVAERNGTVVNIAHQTIGVFSKEGFRLPKASGDEPDITNKEFVQWTKSIWEMPTESPSRVEHPAPFPVELPKRLICLYTFPGHIVLDPFVGTGATCEAALLTGRHYIGYDIDRGYIQTARRRLAKIKVATRRLASTDKQPKRKTGEKMAKTKQIDKIVTTALLGESEVRNREVKVSIQGDEVLLGIKTLGNPDIQKQNITASLSPVDARRFAIAVLKAAENVEPQS